MFKRIKIRSYEVGLKFRDGEFKSLMAAGTHWLFDPLGKIRVRVVSKREPWLADEQLDVIVRSGALTGKAEVLDLKDNQRALVWIDGRFARILGAGLYAYWTGVREVRVEVIDAREVRFEHEELKSIVRASEAARLLDVCKVNRDCVGVLFVDGKYVDQLEPGLYAFWKNVADARVVEVDLREAHVDVSGQDIAEQLELPNYEDPKLGILRHGGPVEEQRGFVLHSTDFEQETTVKVADDFSLTATVDILKKISNNQGPQSFIVALGYSGWGAGQLDQEIQQNSWLSVDADKSIVFNPDLDKLWTSAIGKLGISPEALSSDWGHA